MNTREKLTTKRKKKTNQNNPTPFNYHLHLAFPTCTVLPPVLLSMHLSIYSKKEQLLLFTMFLPYFCLICSNTSLNSKHFFLFLILFFQITCLFASMLHLTFIFSIQLLLFFLLSSNNKEVKILLTYSRPTYCSLSTILQLPLYLCLLLTTSCLSSAALSDSFINLNRSEGTMRHENKQALCS